MKTLRLARFFNVFSEYRYGILDFIDSIAERRKPFFDFGNALRKFGCVGFDGGLDRGDRRFEFRNASDPLPFCGTTEHVHHRDTTEPRSFAITRLLRAPSKRFLSGAAVNKKRRLILFNSGIFFFDFGNTDFAKYLISLTLASRAVVAGFQFRSDIRKGIDDFIHSTRDRR